jgi:excisionase family DNA binding protein
VTEQQLLTVKDVQRLTQLGRTKIYELVRGGRIDVIRVGRVVRFRPEAVDRWLKSNEELTIFPTRR